MVASASVLDALLHGFPDELVDLEGESRGQAVGEHPFDELARVERHVIGSALGAGGLDEGGAEKNLPGFFVGRVRADEVAGEVVVFAVGDDELYFVVPCEGFEIFEAEGVGCAACSGTFDVDDFMDGFGDIGEGSLAAGFDHQRKVLREKAVHQGQEFFGLQHGLAACELNEGAGCQGFDLGFDFVEGEGLAAGEGVLGVAPGAAEVAAGEADEDAGQTGEGGFTLDGFVKFDEMQSGLLVVAGEAGVGFVEGAVLHGDATLGHLVELELGLVVEEIGRAHV